MQSIELKNLFPKSIHISALLYRDWYFSPKNQTLVCRVSKESYVLMKETTISTPSEVSEEVFDDLVPVSLEIKVDWEN